MSRLVYTSTAVKNGTFKIERIAKGLKFRNVPTVGTIKVDLIQKNKADIVVIPEMSIEWLADLFNQLGDRNTLRVNAEVVEVLDVPLATGMVEFNEDNYLLVTFDKMVEGVTAEILECNHAGALIQITKGEIKATDTEVIEPIQGTQKLLFTDGKIPSKIEVYKRISNQQRKIVTTQATVMDAAFLREKDGALELEQPKIFFFDVTGTTNNKVTLYNNGAEYFYYKLSY